MKKLLALVLFTLLSVNGIAQPRHNIAIEAGVAANEFVHIKPLLGNGSYEGQGNTHIGIKYSKNISSSLSIETGISYSENKVKMTPPFYPGIDRTSSYKTIKMFSVPVYARYPFWDYLFLNGGITADFELNYKQIPYINTDNQSGIGVGLGIGGSYRFSKITFYVNSFIKSHAVVPFETKRSPQRMVDTGVTAGLRYGF